MDDIRRAISDKDPERVGALIDLYEHTFKEQLPDNIRRLSPTYKQQQTIAKTKGIDATTEHTLADTRRINAVTEGLGLKNDLDRQSFAAELATRIDKRLLTHEQLDKIGAEVNHLPEKYRLEKLKIETDVEATKNRAAAAVTRAQAALDRAQSAAASTDPAAKARKARFGELKAVISAENTNIDNKRQRHDFWYKRAADLSTELDAVAHDHPERVPAIRRDIAAAKANYIQLSKEMSDARDRSDAAADALEKLAVGK